MKHIGSHQCLLVACFLLCIPLLSKAQCFRSAKDAAKALPERWRHVGHLPNGFPADFQPVLAASAPDGKGGVIEFGKAPTAEKLADLRKRAEQGYLLDYYFCRGKSVTETVRA